jgi:hypothetical protein
MNNDEALRLLAETVKVTREDIARAKAWLVQTKGGTTQQLVEGWLTPQQAVVPVNASVDLYADDSAEQIAKYARAFSLRLAFHQAQWELIAAGELFPCDTFDYWQASLGYRHQGYSGGLGIKGIDCSFPRTVMCPPLANIPPTDPDIFLRGVDCTTLHDGILEAIEQALLCFRRGLYMPATVMMAAAAEATWTECGIAVAKQLSDAKLDATVRDAYVSISKKIAEIQKTLRTPGGKLLLKKAGRSPADVDNAEIWTTNLRERRNALHWGKAKSFLADHSETASLVMGAPLHVGTLEAIRAVT